MSISNNTKSWLYDYQNDDLTGQSATDATPEIFRELLPYAPTEPIRLYRGISFAHPVSNITTTTRKFFTSWSKNLDIAEGYAVNNYDTPYGVVFTAVISPANILVDTTLIPFLPHEESEVMVLPGMYRVEVVKYLNLNDEEYDN
jgi:hypothetical protein